MSNEKDKDKEIDQWIDPNLLLVGQGNVEWAKWATRWLYEGVCSVDKPSHDWPKYGYIDAFDRTLHYNLANANPADDSFQTNNRNWLLIARTAVAMNPNTDRQIDLSLFSLSIQVPPKTFTVEDQPISLTFGSGEWPNYRFYPERWFANVTRTVRVTNNSGLPAVVDLGFLFLQVRTN